jgi:hypothetical protein
MDVEQEVLDFPRKYPLGFTFSDIDNLLSEFPQADKKHFDNALFGVTGIKIDGEFIYYRWDVIAALRCSIEKRGLDDHEWD